MYKDEEYEEYKGITIPSLVDRWDGNNCANGNGKGIHCYKITCYNCLFDDQHENKFKEWSIQRLRKHKLERIING